MLDYIKLFMVLLLSALVIADMLHRAFYDMDDLDNDEDLYE